MTKILITLLTSSNLKCLEASYNSIKNQNKTNIDYVITIVVNTLNNEYYSLVKNKFKDVIVIRTESNGKPGKGKNSLLNIFKQKNEYDYFIPLDGDDILYPCALNRLEIYLKYNPDILMLPFTDILKLDYPNKIQHCGINSKCYLCFNNNLNMREQWYAERLSPFDYNINNVNTPGRLFLLSKKSLLLNLYYDENMEWYDDYITFLQVFETSIIKKDYNIFMLDDKDIYLYNRLNDSSATEKFKIDNDRKKKQEEINFRNSIFNRYLTIRDWNLKSIPFLTGDFNLKFNIFKKRSFVENIIQNLELENIEINKSNYINFLNFGKINRFSDTESFFNELLN